MVVGTLNPVTTYFVTTSFLEVGALSFAPAAQGQYQGPRLVPSFYSAILLVLAFSLHTQSTEEGDSQVAR